MAKTGPRYKKGDIVRLLSGNESVVVEKAMTDANGNYILDSLLNYIYEVRLNNRLTPASEADMVYDHFATSMANLRRVLGL